MLGQGPGTHPRPCVLDKPQGHLPRPTWPSRFLEASGRWLPSASPTPRAAAFSMQAQRAWRPISPRAVSLLEGEGVLAGAGTGTRERSRGLVC